MNAAALIFAEKHCPQCRRMKPVEEFSSHRYCNGCEHAPRAPMAAVVETAEADPPQPAEPLYPPVTPAGEERLIATLLAFMNEFGFTALRVTYTRVEGEIAKVRRGELAREGWIA